MPNSSEPSDLLSVDKERAPNGVPEAVPSISEAQEGDSATSQSPGPLSEEHQRRHHLRKHLQHKDNKSKKDLKSSRQVLVGVNLRDVGAVCKTLQQGQIFRSSELLSKDEMARFNMKTILDLRRMDRPCKNTPEGNKVTESFRRVLKYLILGPQKLVPEQLLPYNARAHYQLCPLCHDRCIQRFERDMNVIHADLIPSTVGLRIFQAMPWRVQFKAVLCACIPGRGAASVMAPAVANPLLLGYKALYRTLLEDSKRGVAQAMRVFVDEANHPVLVHCIHGKDRTGLIIMLLLLLCDVESQAIVDDYVMSEAVLKESRMHDELHLDVYLTSDDVIAATRDTMEETIAYLKEKYGSAARYLHEIGLEDWEIAKIRMNLMAEASPADLKTQQTTLRPRRSIFAFYRRSSSQHEQSPQGQPRLSATSLPIPPKPEELGGTRPSASEVAQEDHGKDDVRRASVAVDGSEGASIRSAVNTLRDAHFATIPEQGGEQQSGSPHSPGSAEDGLGFTPLGGIPSGVMPPPKSPFGSDEAQEDQKGQA